MVFDSYFADNWSLQSRSARPIFPLSAGRSGWVLVAADRGLIETLYRENVSFRDRDLIRLTRCHMASEKFVQWTFTQHTSFFLTSYVTDMNYITHRCFFVYLYLPIHWYLTRILTFLSEQRAPLSTMFASRAFHNVIWSQHSNIQVSIFVTCLNFAGTGSRLWPLYSVCYDKVFGI